MIEEMTPGEISKEIQARKFYTDSRIVYYGFLFLCFVPGLIVEKEYGKGPRIAFLKVLENMSASSS